MGIIDTNENYTDLKTKGRYPYVLFCKDKETFTFVWRSRDLKIHYKTITAKQLEKPYSDTATMIMIYDKESLPVGTFNCVETAAAFLEVEVKWLSMKLKTLTKNNSTFIKDYEIATMIVNPHEDFLRFIGNGKWTLRLSS